MEKWSQNRMLLGLVYAILGLLALFLLLLLKPLLMTVYRFASAVLTPFLIAMVIAYVLHPIVSLLSARRVPRSLAVLLIYAVFCSALAVILMNLIPMVASQVQELGQHAPELTMRAQSLVRDFNHTSFLPESFREAMIRALAGLEKRLAESTTDFINNIGSMLGAVFLFFIIPFLVFYILKDFEVMERAVIACVPKSHRKPVVRMLKDIDEALGSYIRGQFLVCVIIGLLAYAGYAVIGVPYALLLASIVAVTNVIPYLGPFIGAAPALLVASTVSFKMMVLVVVVNTACQILEGNVISPQVVGRTLHIHPLMIIFALLVGGQLAGIPGMILAVPVFAALKVILQHVFAYYVRRRTV
ncbi:AI-2E family transporter [Paenibacillus albicereus]|uniref:AI-2E family transporter n=1 Tax=Paenibacillus albicereus TaxID=2726185 RepID=A0A6H2GZK0_9BACL|nr:AI-2E family transporter [Paenibacillus albicereus]QJC52840.1 AI-2E family transporter [Paenibacillus albicereus]